MGAYFTKIKSIFAEKIVGIEKPGAHLSWVFIKDVNIHNILLENDVVVSNPYNHDLPVCEISYTLLSAGREIASGTIPNPGFVKAKSNTTMKVGAKVPYDFLVSIMRDIGADWDIDYEMKVALTVNLPVVGSFTLPLSTKGTLKLPTLSDIMK